MKKLYMIAAAALTALSASAAAGDWLTVEDFENNPATPGLWNMNGDSATGTASIETIEKDGVADNHVVKFTGGDYNTMLEFKVVLPEGKTMADYKAIDFDVYNFEMTHKPLYVNINGVVVKEAQGNDVGGSGDAAKWFHFSYSIDEAKADNELSIRIGFKCHDKDAFAVDNIRLQEKGEPVAPGTYDETKNGTVTDGWLMVQDYQTKAPGDNAAIWGRYGSPSGTGVVVVDDKAAANLAAEFAGGDYNTYMEVSVKLPEGKTLKDYKAVAFDLYRYSDDDNYKKMLVWAGSELIYEDAEYVEQAKAGTWTTKTYEIPEGTEVEGSFLLHFGISSNNAHYAVDNIRLQEKSEPVAPGTYDETKNGTVTDGWLMLQDYQTKAPGDDATLWGRYGSVAGTGAIAEDAKAATNLVAEFTGGDYNTYMEVSVKLPEGKTLKDYKTVAFDLYRYSDDDNYKKMLVWAGSELIYEDAEYVEQAKAGIWTAKTYEISAATEIEGTFSLRFGISSNKAHYAVDNIRLEERELAAEPEIVDFTHKFSHKARVATLDYVLHVNNHSEATEYTVTLNFTPAEGGETITETNEVHTLVAPEVAAAPARAAEATHQLAGTVGTESLEPATAYNVHVTYAVKGSSADPVKLDLPAFTTLTTGIEDVTVDGTAAPEYYNLQGVRVAQPEAGNIYIVRRGAKVTKELVK